MLVCEKYGRLLPDDSPRMIFEQLYSLGKVKVIADRCKDMRDIIRIAIRSESGYCCIDNAYKDKLTITSDSIRYEYKALFDSEKKIVRSWSYITTSPVFQKLFDNLTALIPEVLTREEEPFLKYC